MPLVENSFSALQGVLQLCKNPAFEALREKDEIQYGVNQVVFSMYINAAAGQYVTLAGVSESSKIAIEKLLDICVDLEAEGCLKIAASESSYLLCPTAKLMRHVETYVNGLVRKAQRRKKLKRH